ncbi:MAG: RNB domain-containing ribonuclease [Granulosicoccus sp.]|nr:RNB domain-containing ribonuclease [Granulosicoccus sp.]
MKDNTPHHWFGEYTGDKITGLFVPELNLGLQPTAPFAVGDIVWVSDSPTLFAPSESALNQILRVLARYKLDPSHPPEVVHAANAYLDIDFLADPTLVNLTHLPFVTIDNPDSRDLDQAVYVNRVGSGYEVHYALADAAWFVPSGSALFEEALLRGVTYYAPDFSVRMLPAVLSENLISLNQGVERRAMVFRINLDSSGEVTSTQVERAIIRSRAKLSYTEVQQLYDHHDNNGNRPTAPGEWDESLLAMRKVGELRIADARRRDVVEFNRREAQVIIDPDDHRKLTIVVRERNDAEKYNEQISLLCNIEGARILQSHQPVNADLQAVYRVHKPPMAMRLDDFRATLQELINHYELDGRFQWQPTDSLADYIAGLPTEDKYSAIRQTIERMAMLTNRASTFEAEPDQHFALGVDAYARFSSPMREVVGIFTHKELYESLGVATAQQNEVDSELRIRVIERANEAKSLQRKLEKEFQLLALDSFLNEDLQTPERERAWHTGVIVGMRTNRIYLHIEGLALDIKVYLEDLNQTYDANYHLDGIRAEPGPPGYDPVSLQSAPVLVIGQRLKAQVSTLEPHRRRYLFNLAIVR